MIILRIDTILKAVSIERGDHIRCYAPGRASYQRAQRLTACPKWVYLPSGETALHAWQISGYHASRKGR